MKPELGRLYPVTWAGWPPHMAARDIPIWNRWKTAHANDYQGFFYDVALGDGTDPGPEGDPTYRYAFIRLTRLRADAIGVQKDAWTLFEVRPNAGAGALGALVTYAALWRLDPPDARSLRPLLITDQIRPDLRPIYAAAGIAITIV